MAENTYEVRGLPPHHSVVLRRKGVGQVWTARIKVPQDEARRDFGRVERSTGCRELDQAIAQAHRLYNEVGNPSSAALAGAPDGGLTFAKAVELFLASEEQKTKSNERSAAQYERERISLLRHFVPEFGAGPIKGITKRQLSAFITKRSLNEHLAESANQIVYERAGERLSYHRALKTPSKETLRRERSAFQALMSWAHEEHYITDEDIPHYPTIRGKGARRTHFSPEAMQHLQHVSLRRISETKHPKRRRERLFCHFRMMTIYLTGCRPQEVALLRFGDFEKCISRDGRDTYRIRTRPERAKAQSHLRTVVALPEFSDVFHRRLIPDLGFSDDEFFFAGPDQKVLGPCNGSFRALVKAAAEKVPRDFPAAGINPSNPYYSLRHTFITERMYEGMPLGEIARLCGTSFEMIHEHYSHVRTEIEQSPKIGPEGFGPYVVPIPPEVWRDEDKDITTLDFYEEYRDTVDDHQNNGVPLNEDEEQEMMRQWAEEEGQRPKLRSRFT